MKSNEPPQTSGVNPVIGILIIIFVLCAIYAIVDMSKSNSSTKQSSNDKRIIQALEANYIGKKYDSDVAYELIEKYGTPETLEGTDNNVWIAYFPKGDFTLIESKGDYIIIGFKAGKNPAK